MKLNFIGLRNLPLCLVLIRRAALKNKKEKKTGDLDVHETKREINKTPLPHILDGFELWGTRQRAGGSAMASVAELPTLPCSKLP